MSINSSGNVETISINEYSERDSSEEKREENPILITSISQNYSFLDRDESIEPVKFERIPDYIPENPLTSKFYQSVLVTGFEGLAELQEFLFYVHATKKVKNGKPVSACFLGASQTGKTSVLESIKGKTVHSTQDVSEKGLINYWKKEDSKNKNALKDTVVITDLTKVLAHRFQTANTAFIFMGRQITDNSTSSNFYSMGYSFKHALKPQYFVSLTPNVFDAHVKNWNDSGEINRWIWILFPYNKDIQTDTFNVDSWRTFEKKLPEINIDSVKPDLVSIPFEFTFYMNALTDEIDERITQYRIRRWDNNGHEISPSHVESIRQRLNENLNQILRSIALTNGRNKVEFQDFERLRYLSKFIGIESKRN